MASNAGRDARRASTYDLGFVVGPRLNAAGRLDDMSRGIECLLAGVHRSVASTVKVDFLAGHTVCEVDPERIPLCPVRHAHEPLDNEAAAPAVPRHRPGDSRVWKGGSDHHPPTDRLLSSSYFPSCVDLHRHSFAPTPGTFD